MLSRNLPLPDWFEQAFHHLNPPDRGRMLTLWNSKLVLMSPFY